MRTAVVYYSLSGNTHLVARQIEDELPADLVRITPTKEYPNRGARKFLWGGAGVIMGSTPQLEPYEFDAAAYDRIIVGTPLWAGSFAPPIRTFANEQREALANKRIAAFVCSSSGNADKCFGKIAELFGTDQLEAQLSLVDPKQTRRREDDLAIQAFCSQLG
ncbi:MAG: flavodoxin domain-containing protein [Coriobacteriales bacterium]|nr:flavodoxin domain-containing protein [Coriobacteriales bacterium]